ncbi:MAG: nucleoside 2-deoxyribosyltransferase domain-containing protein [Myxococcota bacterium]
MTASIFLAGPTPRSTAVASWRPDALRLLERLGYAGTVFVPEPRDGVFQGSYVDQIEWELSGLARADCIAFWVPRDLERLPGFTTNVELGAWLGSGKVVLGAPVDAAKMSYPLALAERARVPRADTLEATLALALALVGEGAPRHGGACQVPLHIYRTPSFQAWLGAQQAAGNTLLGARVEWALRVGPERQHLFYWALHVDVHVAAEGRRKKNEVVLARPDVAAVVLVRRDRASPGRSEVALVREFRSPAVTADGFVHENPSGSTFDGGDDMRVVARDELREEAGLSLPLERLVPVAVRQLSATMSAHRAHVFAVELDAAEMDRLRASVGSVLGADDGERTTLEIWTVDELFARAPVDWSTLGMIASVVFA